MHGPVGAMLVCVCSGAEYRDCVLCHVLYTLHLKGLWQWSVHTTPRHLRSRHNSALLFYCFAFGIATSGNEEPGMSSACDHLDLCISAAFAT